MVFVQETQHGHQGKMQSVTLTQEFTQLHKVNSVKRYGFNIGLDPFLDLKIYGIDMERVIEFLSTLNDNQVATVADQQGQKREIFLTPELVSEALKLPNEGYVLGTWLSAQDKAGVFKQPPRKVLTYVNLKHPDTELLLWLHHQHFEMGRMADTLS